MAAIHGCAQRAAHRLATVASSAPQQRRNESSTESKVRTCLTLMWLRRQFGWLRKAFRSASRRFGVGDDSPGEGATMAHTLRMFMWGYQTHFRALFDAAAQRILGTASSTLYPRALVVGVRHPEAKEGLEICIEPENGPLRESDFLGLAEEIQARIREHPDQHVFYGDDVRMAEKPEWIRQTATLEAV